MLIFTEAREKLGKELHRKQERTHALCHKLCCDWQNNGKQNTCSLCTPNLTVQLYNI